MDKLQWFKFAYADWRMGKIQRCPEITQARFMNLCCLYWSKEGCLSIEDAEIEIDKEHLNILLSKKIIEKRKKDIAIKFLDEQLADIARTSKGKSKAAKARWDKYKNEKQTNADAMHVHTGAMQNDAEKRREEKSRKEISDLGGIIVKPEPTKQIIQQYFLEYGMVDSFTVDETEKFYHYYKQKEWMIGGKPMNVEQACKAWVDNKPAYMYNPEQDKRNKI